MNNQGDGLLVGKIQYPLELVRDIIEAFEAGETKASLSRKYDIPVGTLAYWIERSSDIGIAEENTSIRKKNQRLQDKNRMLTKAYREGDRYDNAIEELLSKIHENIKTLQPTITPKQQGGTDGRYAGIIQLSDVHFNECVHDVGGNSYDFSIAGKRLRKHVLESMRLFDAYGVKNVSLCLTADMYNSDRRLDEILSNADNRAKGFLLGYDIMRQLVAELAAKYDLTVASVCGNEGRIDQIREYGEHRATNNFDFLLHEFLMRTFPDCNFVFQHPNHCILSIMGMNILMVHGDNRYAKDPDKMAREQVTKIIRGNGIRVDYVISGHIHQAYISDTFSRSGSTVGNNAYNFDGLLLSGRASQNCYIIDGVENCIHAHKIDLQDYSRIEGYDITRQLEAYNSKSVEKGRPKTAIHTVVI